MHPHTTSSERFTPVPAFWQRPRFWQWLSVALVVPALFFNLGFLPLDTGSDEPRRALVALEMLLSGDYITPTLNGELYLNKPPLYNWLIAASFRLFGNYSAFALRFPMAVSLLLYALTVFAFVRRYATQPIAFAAALMLVTNARVLLYDSMLGLIDITFSWVTYTAFLLVYHYDQKKKYTALFVTTYALTAIGFLMKGLPSGVFQGLTLLAWFGYTRRWKLLFHPAHFLGIGVFMLIAGAYYIAYFTRNNIPVTEVFGVLFYESSRRTVVEFGIGETLLHLLTFPIDMQHYYAPWMLLIVLLFRPGVRRLLTENRFILFNALTFFVNFVVYWSSPQVYARYLIMLLPLLFTVLVYIYYERTSAAAWQRRLVEGVWLAASVVVTAGTWVAMFFPETQAIAGLFWKVPILFVVLGLIAYQYLRQPALRLTLFIAFMLVVRIGFNWLVIPPRLAHRQLYKDTSEQAARLTLDANGRPLPLFGYKHTIGDDGATDVNSFHIEAVRGEILGVTDRKIPGAYYIADSTSLVGEQYEVIGDILLFDGHQAKIVRFSN
ncbi:hypothetical protein GCM10023189_47130 [Nibrella saemangeumensis]|uniref:Glycosyltransferase RgtA/B/C/D-like domain-containing protein n=1 Tax=Nibrella saemangeumensis TaxID=1084526 RepID=A0ABP8NHC3_9BACT